MAPADTAREADTLLADLELSRSLTIQFLVVGILGFGVAWAGFAALFQATTGHVATFDFAPSGVGWWTDAHDLLVLLVLGIGIVPPHELLHGLAIRYYGGTPRYGAGVAYFVLPYGYATTDHVFDRNQFVVVLLAPLIVMTLVGVPAMIVLEWGWLAVPLAANAGGAVGDVWMTLTLLQYPPHVRTVDHRTGFRILGRDGDHRRDLSVPALAWNALVGAAAATVGLLVTFALVAPPLLSALGVDSIVVGRPGTVTHVFSFVAAGGGFSFEGGLGVPALGALVGLVYAFVRTARRRHAATDEPGE